MKTAEENALQAWVVVASGYAASNVLWERQDITRPTTDYIMLRVGAQDTDGAFDYIEAFTDLSRPAGQEVELRVTGWRSCVITVQAFTHATQGDTSSHEILSKVQTALALPSIREPLDAAGIGPTFDRGTVTPIPALLGSSRFESRAFVDIGFYRSVSASDYIGYIDEVRGAGDLQGSVNTDGAVDFDANAG